MTTPEAGWYSDPDGDGQRWWDGQTWTDHRREQAPPPAAPPTSSDAASQPVINVAVGATPAPAAAIGHAMLGSGEWRALASPGKRLGARLLDTIIILLGQAFLGFFGVGTASRGTGGGESMIAAFVGIALTLAFLAVVYEVTLTALYGRTVGKMLVGIQVVRADTGDVPGWGKAIIRWLLPFIFIFVPVLGVFLHLLVYGSLTWDNSRQGWHDKAAGTLVVDYDSSEAAADPTEAPGG